MTNPAVRDRSACLHAVQQLWDYLDGRLPAPSREWVDAHLATCDGCASHYRFERGFLEALGRLHREDDQFAALRARVQRAVAARAGGDA
jgi:anti-sigma factor (TIGR02949 family)